MTIYYPPGWDGPIEPSGQIVGAVGGQPHPRLSPASAAALPLQPPAPVPPVPLHAPPGPPAHGVATPSPTAPPLVTALPVGPPPAAPPATTVPMTGMPATPWAHSRSLRRTRVPALFGVSINKRVAIVVGLVVVGLVGVAVDQNLVARKWQHNERIEAVRGDQLSTQLTQANSQVQSLSSQVTSLQGDVNRLDSKLSAAATAKEKALDQNTVLTSIARYAGAVSSELSTCVDDMQGLVSEIAADVASNFADPSLQSNAYQADTDCASAQSANNSLQTVLNGGG